MLPICNLLILAFPAARHNLPVALAARRIQQPKPSIGAQARARAIIPLRPEAGAGGQDVLTAEVAEDALSEAAVKLHAPQHSSPPTTAKLIAQRTCFIAAASRGTYSGFPPTKENTRCQMIRLTSLLLHIYMYIYIVFY